MKYPNANSISVGLKMLRKEEGRKDTGKKKEKTHLKWVFALYAEKIYKFLFQIYMQFSIGIKKLRIKTATTYIY